MVPISDAAMRARKMYADGATVEAIVKATRLKYSRIYYWLDGGDGRLPPLPRRRRKPDERRGKLVSRRVLVRRLMRLAELQVSEVERRSMAAGVELPDPEGNGRAISVLARTLRDLTALDELNRNKTPGREQKQSHDEPVARDLDELRAQLLRKMDAALARSENRADGGDDT